MSKDPSTRKISFNDKEIKQFETMAGLGLPMDKMSAIMGCGKRVVERLMAENNGDNPLSDAIKKGRAIAEYNVAKVAYDIAVNERDRSMIMFWLKCRANWRDVRPPESDEKTIIINIDTQDARL